MTGQRLGAGVFTAVVVLAGPVPATLAHGDDRTPGPRVVADGLDDPRQLNWDQRGQALIVAEAGRGGPERATPMNPFGAAAGGGAVWEPDFSNAYSPDAAEE